MRRKFYAAAVIAAATALFAVAGSASGSTVTTANGTWDAYPGQSASYQTAVKGAIKPDGSSNFKANSKGVIPVQFALSEGTGPFVFESIYSDNPGVTANDYSYLDFTPNTAPTLAQITSLIANYQFTEGDCQGGSLRWTLYLDDQGTTRNLDVHYQPGAGGLSTQTCAAGTSGKNMADLTSTDPYVVINQFTYSGSPYTFSSSYNVTYDEAVNQLGGLQVLGMNLIVDSGWGANGDQVVNLTNASIGVGGASGYTDTFTPQSSSGLSPTCNLPTDATIKVTKAGSTPTGVINDAESIQPNDNNGIFRVVDCKLMYNLAVSSLWGAGTYTVQAVINGTPVAGAATFDLK